MALVLVNLEQGKADTRPEPRSFWIIDTDVAVSPSLTFPRFLVFENVTELQFIM